MTPEPSVAYVTFVKNAVVAAGIPITGPCGAFEITRRVAWGLRGQGYGLVHKEEHQNGCTFPPHGRFSVDVVMLPNGAAWDILVNAETENSPAWNPVGTNPPPALWRAPFESPLPGEVPQPPVPPPPQPPEPPVPPVPPPSPVELIQALQDINDTLRHTNDSITSLLLISERIAQLTSEIRAGVKIRL